MTVTATPANLTNMDPQARALLDRMAADGVVSLQGLTPPEARKAFAAIRSKYQLPMADVDLCETHVLSDAKRGVRVRVYRGIDTDRSADLPVLMFLHGGGWMVGDLDSYDGLCARIANEVSCCVVSVDYRLAPENPFPAALDDAALALRWLQRSAEMLRIDPSRIALGGDSAGATLTAALALMSRDKVLPSILFQLLVYPCLDMSMSSASFRQNWAGAPLTSESMSNYIANYVPDPELRKHWPAAPLRSESVVNAAPSLIISTGIDPLRDDSFAYANQLQNAGVPVVHLHFSDQFHGFLPMWHLIDAAERAMTFLCASLSTALCRPMLDPPN